MRQRPGQKVFTVPGPAWGVRVVQPAAPPADWWDPDNEGLSVVGAYRAINSVGTPWPGGPANYAESLVNQANPGVNDLIEGNGAVPWAAATGWGFVAAGSIVVRLEAVETAKLDALAKLYYDVQWTDGTDVLTPRRGRLLIISDVTRATS